MSAHKNLESIREAVDAFNEGRGDALMGLIHPDAVFVIPGGSPISGTYAGADRVRRFFGKLASLAGSSQRIELLHLLSGGEDVVVAVWRVRASRKGIDFEGVAGFVFRMRDGLIVEALNLQADQDAVDASWSA